MESPKSPRVPWSSQDTIGVAIVAAITIGPMAVITYVLDSISKDGPIGLPAYLLPCGAALLATALSTIAALVVGRSETERLGLHLFFGCLGSLVLLIGYCGFWGDWWFQYVSQFRN